MTEIRLEHQGDVLISHWPKSPSAEMVHSYFDQLERLLVERPRAVVLNALAVESAPISVRDAAGRRLKINQSLLERTLLGQATVLRSTLVRGALATVHFFSPPRYPVSTFDSLEEATAWAKAQLTRSVRT